MEYGKEGRCEGGERVGVALLVCNSHVVNEYHLVIAIQYKPDKKLQFASEENDLICRFI